MLLFSSVERCFVFRMRDFLSTCLGTLLFKNFFFKITFLSTSLSWVPFRVLFLVFFFKTFGHSEPISHIHADEFLVYNSLHQAKAEADERINNAEKKIKELSKQIHARFNEVSLYTLGECSNEVLWKEHVSWWREISSALYYEAVHDITNSILYIWLTMPVSKVA